jgi:NAD(P)-dependent dehydrogenase (short-subunit alcohol dehydrogenase family)
MTTPDDRWVVVSGANGVLGRALVSHFAAKGSRILALDRKFDATTLPGVIARSVDLLVEADVRQALSDTIPPTEPIALLINAVGLI